MTRGSQAQQGIWFAERKFGVGPAYHMPLAVHLDGAVDVDALRRAVAAVLTKHPLLGMALVDQDGMPHLRPGAAPPVEETDEDVAVVLRRETDRPFDLATGPLCRVTLVRRPSGVTVVVAAHHAVFDGTSKDVLVHDLAAAYNGVLDADPVPFTDIESDPSAAKEFWARHWHEPGELILPGLRASDDPSAGSVGLDLKGLDPAALGVTTFESLVTAWIALLRGCGNHRPVVGVDLGTRTPGRRTTIGPYVNELPVSVSPQQTMQDLATGVRTELRELYRHRTVPLGRAVPGLPPRPSVAPTSISYRRRSANAMFDGLTSTVDWMLPAPALRSIVHLQVVEGPSGLTGALRYRTACLDATAAARLAADFEAILAAGPEASFSDPTSTLTGPTRPVPDCSVYDLFARQAAATPDAIAVVGDGELTYGDLADRAGRIAGGLREAGVKPGALVAVRMRRGPDLVAALLGIWRAGAAYVPVDPAYPERRRTHMLRDSGAVLTITDDLPDGAVVPPVAAETAYVIYTSGSTGQPKGVVVPHRALANLLLAVGEVLAAGPEHRWLALTSLSFDISGLELFLPLITGGRVVLADDGRDGKRVAELVAAGGVTHVQATPTGWRVLLDAGVDWPEVTALTGGEALPVELARELRPRVLRLLNMYGPTETTIWSTWWEVPAEPAGTAIGRPLANTTASVRDETGTPVPDGVVGELWLGGAGLATGYLGRPDLTAERFPDGQHYRTGDLVRVRDGELEFVGRADTQVKVRGHRVELGEIETRLAEHPAVRSAVVLLRGGDLVAYLEGDAEPAELRTHLADTLPEHMLPARFVPVTRWPTTPNGKLDRDALPDPPAAQTAVARPGLLGEVGAIWTEVLRLDVGPDDDLFDLGGHSLTMTQIAARVRDRIGVDVVVDAFYDAPTLAEFTAVVAKLRDRP